MAQALWRTSVSLKVLWPYEKYSIFEIRLLILILRATEFGPIIHKVNYSALQKSSFQYTDVIVKASILLLQC